MPHLVDLARWLTGAEPELVRASERPYRERVEIRDDRGRMIARCSRGGP